MSLLNSIGTAYAFLDGLDISFYSQDTCKYLNNPFTCLSLYSVGWSFFVCLVYFFTSLFYDKT